jgi:hypothetical protein
VGWGGGGCDVRRDGCVAVKMHRQVLCSKIDGDWVLSAVVVITVGGWFFVLQCTFVTHSPAGW